MNMEQFENRLAQLPVARPSADLRRRIFNGAHARRSWLRELLRHGIPVGLAASIAIVAGLAGSFFGRAGTGTPRTASSTMSVESAVSVQVIQGDSDRNVFDFTQPLNDSIYDDFDVAVVVEEGEA